jgi:AraC-like DNA-binding protein
LVCLQTLPQELKRSRYHIGRGGEDCYLAVLNKQGSIYFPAHNETARPGDLVVMDRGEPLITQLGAHSAENTLTMLCYTIPKRVLDPLLVPSERGGIRIFEGARPLVALFRQHMYAMQESLPGITLREAQAIQQPTVELLAATMNGGAGTASKHAVENAVLYEICRHIDAHIMDVNLSAASIAGTFGVSKRKLYKLFEPYGGVLAYIQKQRLARVHQALVDPAAQHRRIQDIAESYGFMQRKNFTAAFRRVYGLTPREARAFALAGRSRNMHLAQEDQTLWNWMLTLR